MVLQSFLTLLLLLFQNPTVALTPSLALGRRQLSQFNCSLGISIPHEWVCDNVQDCEGGKDEVGCKYLHQCAKGAMMCPDGSCIEASYKCNGEADCINGEDELCDHIAVSVDTTMPRKICRHPDYSCKIGNVCLKNDELCDGFEDCPGGDDELGCNKTNDTNDKTLPCAPGHRKCASDDICIPYSWICDGTEDCDDGSDEQNCDGEDYRDVALCSKEQYRCQGGVSKCIPVNQTCDGVVQCPLKDDESSSKCGECKSLRCEHRCHMTENDVQCYCPTGKERNADRRTCSDIDFCQTLEGKSCQHYCKNIDGGYICHCSSGYSLEEDKHTCHANNQKGNILLAIASEIRRMPLSVSAYTNETYRIYQYVGVSESYLDYNNHNGILYMAAHLTGSDRQLTALVNGSVTILRESMAGLDHIAVDFIGGNIFFCRSYPATNPGIYACTEDGLFCRKIIDVQRHDSKDRQSRLIYRGFAVDSNSGRMFWIEKRDGIFKIIMSNLDGTEIKTLIDSKLVDPTGLAYDPIRSEIYFSELSFIEKFNIKSGERHVIFSKGIHYLHSIKYFDGILYWTDLRVQSLKYVNVRDHRIRPEVIHTFRENPTGFAINHSNYQIVVSPNPCEKIKRTCFWICVPILDNKTGKLQAVCLCPDNYEYFSEEDRCIPVKNATFNKTDSFLGRSYIEMLCEKGSFCLNGGKCLRTGDFKKADTICSCPSQYFGLRCESYNGPLHMKDRSGTGWTSFWRTLSLICLIIVIFIVLYQKSRKVKQFVRSLFGRRDAPDFTSIEPFMEEVQFETVYANPIFHG